LNEEVFINQLISGDQSAYKLLVDQYGQKVYNTVLGFLQNNEDAEEITQDVFIEVFRSIHQFKGKSLLSTWIYRISVTKSLDFLRRKNRKKRFAIFQNVFIQSEAHPIIQQTNFYHPGVLLQNKEQAAILFAAIDKLPENQKTAFILHKLDDLSYSQIAEIMNVSLSSVESLMFRAKQKLQNLLRDYYENNLK
jgi:RNA polymerase sigma-70 factor (ECF subfamily)